MPDTPLAPLLATVFTSILEVFLICLAGYVLASTGVLDRTTQKQINRLNVSVFTPSLLFSKVAFFLSPAKLRELWIIPIFFVIVTLTSMTVAFLLSALFRIKPSQRSFAMAAAMFMNSNSLPIALMQSLVVTVPGLKWGPDDNNDAMLGRALTYLVLYSSLGMILRWSYGVHLLTQADPDPTHDDPEHAPLLPPDIPPPPAAASRHRHEDDELSDDCSTASPDSTAHAPDKLHPPHADFFRSFPNSPTHTSPPATLPSSEDDDDDEDDVLPAHRRAHTAPTASRLHSLARRTRHRLARALRTLFDFMTVPLWASLLSLVVACVQPLQHALEEHMQPVKGALAAAGNCSIPLTLIVLGGYFYTPPEERGRGVAGAVKGMFGRRKRRSRSILAAGREPSRPGETRTVAIAVLARMVITPLLLLPLMALSTSLDLQSVFDDPVFVVANVLLIASPPAVTLAQITQAASGDSFERLISRTIFWAYCVVTPPSTVVVVVIGLLLSKL